jgi:hypothetical protein
LWPRRECKTHQEGDAQAINLLNHKNRRGLFTSESKEKNKALLQSIEQLSYVGKIFQFGFMGYEGQIY